MIAIPPTVPAGSFGGGDLGFHRLKSPELEDRFRASRLQRDRAQMVVVAIGAPSVAPDVAALPPQAASVTSPPTASTAFRLGIILMMLE